MVWMGRCNPQPIVNAAGSISDSSAPHVLVLAIAQYPFCWNMSDFASRATGSGPRGTMADVSCFTVSQPS